MDEGGESSSGTVTPSDLRGRASSEFDWDETSRDSSETSSRGTDSRPRLGLPSLLPQDFSRLTLMNVRLQQCWYPWAQGL